MKKFIKPPILIALIAALVLVLSWAAIAKAQGGLTYKSGIMVVNNGSAEAHVILTFYDSLGNSYVFTDTIALGSANSYYDTSMPSVVPANFRGSLVISSDQPVSANSNLLGSLAGYSYGAATASFSQGSNTFNLPQIMCNNGGFNTFFSVQNTATTDAHIKIRYNPIAYGTTMTETATIKPGTSQTFDQAVGSATYNCSTIGTPRNGVNVFVGSAAISSDNPIVATVMILNNSTDKKLNGYNGFADGSTTVNLPQLQANNGGFYSGWQVMNVGTVPMTVTVDYSSYGANHPANDICVNVLPGKACNGVTNYNPADPSTAKWQSQYVGGATITNDKNQKMVAIVNLVKTGLGSAYEGFDPAAATERISLPVIMARNSGFVTGIQIMNVGGGNCASISVTYSPNLASTWMGMTNPSVVTNLGNGESISLSQFDTAFGWPRSTDPASYKYVGSAEVYAPGCKVVALVNEVNLSSSSGDTLFTYDGLNH